MKADTMSVRDCPHMCPKHIPNNPDCQLCRTIFLLWKADKQNSNTAGLLQVEPASRMRMAETIMSNPGQRAMLIFEHPLTENNKGRLRHLFGHASVYVTECVVQLSAAATEQYHNRYPWNDSDRPMNRIIVYYMQGGMD